MRNTIGNRAARTEASEKERLAEIKMKMVMRIYRASRARALKILAEHAAEKAAQEAEEAAREAKNAANREALQRRLAEIRSRRK